MMIDKELRQILVCPKCKREVAEKGKFLICRGCRLAYPVIDKNTPDMVLEDALPIDKVSKGK